MQRRWNRVLPGMAVVALAVAAAGGCGRVKEVQEKARAEREREEQAAAVRPEAMGLEIVGGRGTLDTAQFAGEPWLLLAFRAGDPVCRDAVAEWNGLAERWHVAAVLTDAAAGGEPPAAALEVASAAGFPACAATRAQLDALAERAPLEVNPVAFLFDGAGRLVRATEGHARVEHHAEDLAALAAGRELPEHPAQGVLPEENEP